MVNGKTPATSCLSRRARFSYVGVSPTFKGRRGTAMEIALISIIAVLFVLVGVVAVKGRRGRRAAREQELSEARVTAGKAKAQQEGARSRQAGVRAAHAERAQKVDSDTNE
jgi:hypothetical protein